MSKNSLFSCLNPLKTKWEILLQQEYFPKVICSFRGRKAFPVFAEMRQNFIICAFGQMNAVGCIRLPQKSVLILQLRGRI